ncbi:MAG: restriction endonuclease subunit S [Melioribacteraceae bacterium]|nr:restriction endonuclease subunit S [Melioribacteraceae bacterium]
MSDIWKEYKFGDLVYFPPKISPPKNKVIPFIDMELINPSYRYVTNEISKKFSGSASKFENNDVLFARITPSLENRKIAQAKINGIGFGSTEFFVLRAKKSLCDQNYLYYLAKTDYIVENAINSFVGASGRQRADDKFIKRLKVKIPPLPTQRKIAAILSAYDDLIENNNKRISILENTAEQIYKEWFLRFRFPGYKKTKFIKGIPEGWEVKKVKDVVNRKTFGKIYRESDLESEGSVIVIDQSVKEYFGFYEGKPEHLASEDDPYILFGDHSCKMLIMTEPFSLSENVIPIKAKDNIPLYFLFYLIKSLVTTTEYKRHWTELSTKEVFIPSEYLRIEFNEIVKPLLIQINSYKKIIRNLSKTRDFLLPRFLSGKLSVENLDIKFPPSMEEIDA